MSEMPNMRRYRNESAGSDSGPHTPPHSGLLPRPQISPLSINFDTELGPRQRKEVPAASAAGAGQRNQRQPVIATADEIRRFDTDRPRERKPITTTAEDIRRFNTDKPRERKPIPSKFTEHLDSRRLGTLGHAERNQDHRDVALQALEGAPDAAAYRARKPLPPLPKPAAFQSYIPADHVLTTFAPLETMTQQCTVPVSTRPRTTSSPAVPVATRSRTTSNPPAPDGLGLTRTNSYKKFKQLGKKLSLQFSDTVRKGLDMLTPTSPRRPSSKDKGKQADFENEEIDLTKPVKANFDYDLAYLAFLADEKYEAELEAELTQFESDVMKDGLRDAWKQQEQSDRKFRIDRRKRRERDGESIHTNESDYSFFAGKRDPQAKYKRGLIRLLHAHWAQEQAKHDKLGHKCHHCSPPPNTTTQSTQPNSHKQTHPTSSTTPLKPPIPPKNSARKIPRKQTQDPSALARLIAADKSSDPPLGIMASSVYSRPAEDESKPFMRRYEEIRPLVVGRGMGVVEAESCAVQASLKSESESELEYTNSISGIGRMLVGERVLEARIPGLSSSVYSRGIDDYSSSSTSCTSSENEDDENDEDEDDEEYDTAPSALSKLLRADRKNDHEYKPPASSIYSRAIDAPKSIPTPYEIGDTPYEIGDILSSGTSLYKVIEISSCDCKGVGECGLSHTLKTTSSSNSRTTATTRSKKGMKVKQRDAEIMPSLLED
ncbi:hypothetical protein BDV97DRAFT_409793 [Delphinella strobiligena]|nr:hypothetical protein BDV97DRAFT_409793 [Delphinella strobiligena]